MIPPCAGRYELFDSIEPVDHAEARAYCLTCPLLDACRKRLQEATRDAYSAVYGPAGTWAGELIGGNIRTRREQASEEAMFDDDLAREAHAAFTRGERGDMVRIGERVYQRRKKRGQMRRRDAA